MSNTDQAIGSSYQAFPGDARGVPGNSSGAPSTVGDAGLGYSAPPVDAGHSIAVTYDTDVSGNPDYTRVTLGTVGSADGVVLGNLSDGAAPGNGDAINGGQLHQAHPQLAGYLGAGAQYATGTWAAPQFQAASVGTDGSASVSVHRDFGSAFAAVDGSLVNLKQRIDGTDDSTRFVVTYDTDASGNPDYTRVTLGHSDSGAVSDDVAAGAISTDSDEAVNGAELFASQQALAGAFGGGVGGDPASGIWTEPSHSIGSIDADGSVAQASSGSVGDAFAAVDDSLSSLSEQVSQLQSSAAIRYFNVNSDAADSEATGTDAVAIGPEAVAAGDSSVALGYNASTGEDATDAVAIGTDSQATADGTVAIGSEAEATATDAVAIGDGAEAQAENSVALGAGSVADRANTVSVGSAGNERQITNVAAGTEDTDAVNVAQLKASEAGSVRYDTNSDGSVDYSSVTLGGTSSTSTVTLHNVAAGTAATDAVNVGQLEAGIADAKDWSKSYTDQRISQVNSRASAGIASAMAMASLPQPYEAGRSMASVAASSFSGESGVAVGLSGVTEGGRWIYKLSGSTNTRGEGGVSIGAGIQW
ncbi:MAG: YadA-like family protein [Pseudomonas sp.]